MIGLPLRRAIRALLTCLLVAGTASATALPTGFQETVVLSGLTEPTAVRFASDGRVFVAEKSGIIKVFPSLGSTAPTVFADLRTNVHNYWDRGLLGLELHPNFPATPYVYVLYTLDAQIGGTPPRWGTFGGTVDGCPTPPGPTTDGCPVAGRLSRLTALGNLMTGTEQVLLENWCQQFPSHSIGTIAFGADGALYVGAGEGADFNNVDYGQHGIPKNPCDDPPTGSGGTQTPPSALGGALRSQNVGLGGFGQVPYGGKVLRIDPISGAALPDNPLAGSAIAGQDRVIAYGFRNPFRLAPRPGTNEIWVGDVGWSTWEEIDRISNPTGSVTNFGWPCYEGPTLQQAFLGTNLTACNLLYNNPGAVLGPVFAWNHGNHVGTGDHCGTGSSSVSGIAFYNGGGYPPNYNGALFFADYSRNCIWTMLPGAGGDPDPSTRAAFAEGAPGPVDLQIGPGGDLYYVDLNGGKVRRIQSFSTNEAPVAVIDSDVTGGVLPLTIHFDASASYDPEGGAVTYSWDLNGDGVFGDSTAVAPQFTYNAVATVTVGLQVTDALGAKGVTFLDITPGSLPPTVTILTPADGSTWNVGSTISFSGQAIDPQDGLLAPSRLTWQLIMHHCPSDCHTHPVQLFPGTASGGFAAPDHSYPSYLELELTATNSRGLSASTSIVLLPNTVTLNFQTSPSGLLLSVGPSTNATPFSATAIRNSHNSLSAPLVQALGSLQYYFSGWSDGGAASHDIVASGSSTYTASYGSVPPTIYGAATGYATGNETHGVTTGDFDGDGDLDIAAANHLSSNVSVLRGNGDGTFQAAVNYLVGNGPKSVAAGDFNKDGKLDLVTGNQEGDNVSVLLGNGDATYQPRVDYPTCSRAHEVAVADLNADGKQDLAVACWGGSVISVLLGNGNGTFQAAVNYATGSAPHSIVARDFDGDGLLDLAVANHTGDSLSVLRGNGDGTFQPPVDYPVGVGPHSLRSADLNFDGRLDLAVVDDGSDDAEVLLNNGDGTFATPLSFPTGSVPKGIGLGDLNGDGLPDIVATNTAGNYPTCCHVGGDKVQVLLGNGDGTFGPPVTYTVGTTPFGVAIADLNGDGLQDLVTANWHSNNVTVLLNGNPGGLPTTTLVQTTTTITALTTSTSTSSTTSTTVALPSPWLHQDIGAVGLAGSAGLSGTTFSIGASGNDIWDTADAFHFVYQPWTGDVDIVARVVTVPATDPWAKAGVMIRESLTAGSRHAMVVATSANGIAFQRRTATSGLTTHTSGPSTAAPYWVRLTRSGNTFSAYASANGSTWTLIGTDSIPMATAVFVGMPVTSHNNTVRGFATIDGVSLTGPTPNVPPTVSLTSPSNGASYAAPATVDLAATAADSDGTVDHVDFYAGPTFIGSDSTAPYGLSWNNVAAGNYTLTAIATDNGGLSTPSAPVGITVTGGAGTLPPPWAQADIGSVAYAGTGTFAGGTFTMTGSGNDIWDFADAFHFVYQPLTGDGEIIARVAALQNTNAWAKAGVMIRETLTAGSRHAMVVVTTGNGVAFQRRTATGGSTSHTSGPSAVAPYWVRLTRSGGTFTAYASPNGSSWTQVGIDSIPMAASVYIGLPVTSHDNTLVTTATVDGVALSGGVAPTTTTTLPPATTTTTSTSSTSTSSTSTTAPVPTTTSTSTSTTSTSTSTSTSTTASTTSTSSTSTSSSTSSTSTSTSTSTSSTSTTVAAPTTTSTSTSTSTSTTASTTSTSSTSTSSSTSSTSTSTSSTSTTVAAPTTTSTSTTVSTTSTSSTSTSSSTSSTAPVPTTTSSTTSSTSTSTSSTNSTSTTSSTTATSSTSTSTSSTSTTLPPTTTTTSSTTTTTAPSGWTDQDIGSVGVAGGVTLASGTFSVTGSGADIWNTADAFHFVYQQLTGDGQIVARVASVQNTDPWAKAGVMIRASLAAGSAQAFMAVTPGNGVVYQRRTTTGGLTTHSPGPVATAPYWVRLVRAGNVVTGYASADGSTWTAIGSDTLPLGTTAYFGLAVTSHNDGVLCLSTFDNVSLGTLAQSLPPPWLDGDVGGVGAPGAGTYANGTFTATGSGADIWGTADQFHFVYRPLAGDGQITARVASVPTTDPWAKAGVMIRETLATGSAHGMMIVSNARGAAFQWRSATGGTSSNVAGPAVTAPYWVRLVRSGNLISAYASANGTTFTLVGSATIPMAANVFVGLPVTSHNNLLVGTATFTDVQ